MNISLNVTRVNIDPNGNRNITVDIEGADHSEVLDNFSASDILSHFGIGKFLDEIGEDECISHFGIDIKED